MIITTLSWNSKFVASAEERKGDVARLVLRGVLIDTSANKNNWMVDKEDFEELGRNFIGKQIRVDHSEKVEDVKGIIKSTEIDSPHKEAKDSWDPPNENFHIHYLAELSTNDENILTPIKLGYVSAVSPAVDAKTLLCSKCKTPMMDKFLKQCDCEDSVVLLKDITARELSIVASPAYEGTVMKPFGASVDETLRGNLSKERILNIVEDELVKRNVELIE